MNFESYQPLREQLQRESFTRQQLVELFGDLAFRVCRIDAPEIEAIQHDISDAHEGLREAMEKVEAREARVVEIAESHR